MLPYLSVLFFVSLTAYFGRCIRNKAIRNTSVFIILTTLILFSGLRDGRIGTDTEAYVSRFLDSSSSESIFLTSEIGYGFLVWVARNISNSYSVLLLLVAMMVVFSYASAIFKLAERYEIAFFLFIALGVYTFSFNGARQGVAAGFCFMAIPFLLQRKFIPYVLSVIFATFFHQTAWVAILLYPIASKHVDWHRLVFVGFATVLLVLFLQIFVGFAVLILDDKFSAYAEVGQGGGELWVAFLVCQGLLLFYFKKIINDPEYYYARLLNIYLAGLVIALASIFSSINPSGLLRLHLYFSSVSIIMWPMVFRSFTNFALRDIIAFLFVCVAVSFFFLTTSSFSNLTPYLINQDLRIL